MAEYIDKQKLLKYLEETNTADEWIANQYNADWIYSFIESQPTADVEKVVRCRNCNHCEIVIDKFDNDWYFCKETKDKAEVNPNDFCSYGTPKERGVQG